MILLRKLSRAVGISWVVGLLLASSVCVGQETQDLARKAFTPAEIADNTLTGKERFQRLLIARDDEYERQRLVLFADANAVAYLPERFNDPDPVAAFIARHLHLWVTQHPAEFAELERFLDEGIYTHKEKRERTVAGWQPNQELSVFLTLRGNELVNEHLLLRLLMRPKTSAVWMYGGALEYYSSHPVGEPEVWIRKALEDGNDSIYVYLANYSLRITDRYRTLRALNFERVRAKRLKQSFPPQLEALRNELVRTNRK
jgi:hypothetical protein